MNKALHVFVYLFLILAGAALFFEMQLNDKRRLLTDRNRIQENYILQIAATIEKEAPEKKSAELAKDVEAVEAKIVDMPETENVLEDYEAQLEAQSLDTFQWGQPEREQLRNVYVYTFDGKIQMDGDRPLMEGPGTEDELLKNLLKACMAQRARLDTTRDALAKLHQKLDKEVAEINKMKPEMRQDKVTIVEKNEKIAKLEGDKADLENQIVKIKAQIDELNAEITSLKDEVVTAHDETDAAKEDLAKANKLVEQLKKLLQEALAAAQGGTRTGMGVAVSSVPSGDKGKIIDADNENMFATVEFTPQAMKELKGNDLSRPLPAMEFGVKRAGFNGEAGEFVGRIRLRQEVPGKNYIICDILTNWEQDKLKADDVVFAD
ncbi:MAG: hypothetical protein IIY62_05505 [Kiritimatiellae bacterium]|jgi:outer membrane murein-binding lipoprotein Lpp|nr:hypothetical protein [Kiritimatiellia bacterium]